MDAVETRFPTRRLVTAANTLLPGLYAWLTTVALPSTSRGSPALARFTALAALLALLSGPLIAILHPRLGRAIGVLAFVGLCLGTWYTLGPAIGVGKLDPLRAALGGLGWALFALGWGSMREVGSVPEDNPNFIAGPPLPARSRLPAGAMVILGLSLACAVPPLYLAWRVPRPDHALFAHATAILCSVALVGAGARIAVERGAWQPPSSARQRANAAVRPLAALALVLGLGFVWLLLR